MLMLDGVVVKGWMGGKGGVDLSSLALQLGHVRRLLPGGATVSPTA